jgi:hypothetical protein
VKIVAQSIVVPSTPYVHLGYLAAAYRPRPRDAGPAGSVVITLAVVVLFVLAVARNAPEGTPISHLRKKGRLLLCSAGILTLVGFALLVWKEKLPVYADPVARTHEQGLRLLKERGDLLLERFEELYGPGDPSSPYPRDFSCEVSGRFNLDGWNYRMRAFKQNIAETFVFCITSAGPDHTFGNGDDVLMSLGPRGELEIVVRKPKASIE